MVSFFYIDIFIFRFPYIYFVFNSVAGILREAKQLETFTRQSASANQRRPLVRRALFTVGLLLRHFDFTDKDVIEGLEVCVLAYLIITLILIL